MSAPDRRAMLDRADRTLSLRRQGDRRRQGCGHDGQRLRVAHMPTAAEKDAASRCMIERKPERSGSQVKNRFKRSRCAGPLHFGWNSTRIEPFRWRVARSDKLPPKYWPHLRRYKEAVGLPKPMPPGAAPSPQSDATASHLESLASVSPAQRAAGDVSAVGRSPIGHKSLAPHLPITGASRLAARPPSNTYRAWKLPGREALTPSTRTNSAL